MSESSVPISRLRVADPDGLVGAIRGSELEPWALGGHPGESELLRILLPGSCLDLVRLGPAMWFRGSMPKDSYTMGFVTACPGEGQSFNFNSRYHGQCLGFYAPGDPLDVMTPAGYRNATLAIPEQVFLQAVESGQQDIPARLLKRGDSLFPSAEACRDLTAFLGAMSESVRQTPEAFTSGTARDALESELHDHFFRLIRTDRGDGTAAPNPGISRPYLRMHRVRDFIRGHSRRRIRLDELCAVSGLSRRGIEYLF